MNKRIIKRAHVVAIGIFLAMGLVVSTMHGQNSNQSAGQQNQNSSSQKRSSDQNSGGGMSVSSADRKFATTAAMDGMTEVELGRVATQRGTSDAVKQFGQRMVDDHSKANSELMQLATAQGITLPTGLDAKHQSLVAKMSALSGAAFDKAYAKQMVGDHNKAVALFQNEASRGGASELKNFAATTRPTLQEHLSMARSLPTGNKSGGSGSGLCNGNTNSSGPR